MLYILPISYIPGTLPVVRAGDTGTNRSAIAASVAMAPIATATTSPAAGDGCPMYFVNSWAQGWSNDA